MSRTYSSARTRVTVQVIFALRRCILCAKSRVPAGQLMSLEHISPSDLTMISIAESAKHYCETATPVASSAGTQRSNSSPEDLLSQASPLDQHNQLLHSNPVLTNCLSLIVRNIFLDHLDGLGLYIARAPRTSLMTNKPAFPFLT